METWSGACSYMETGGVGSVSTWRQRWSGDCSYMETDGVGPVVTWKQRWSGDCSYMETDGVRPVVTWKQRWSGACSYMETEKRGTVVTKKQPYETCKCRISWRTLERWYCFATMFCFNPTTPVLPTNDCKYREIINESVTHAHTHTERSTVRVPTLPCKYLRVFAVLLHIRRSQTFGSQRIENTSCHNDRVFNSFRGI
jgi:hypothetical protein